MSCVEACSGLGPTMLGVSHVAIQFPLYEYLKTKVRSNPARVYRPCSPLIAIAHRMDRLERIGFGSLALQWNGAT